MRSTRSGSAPCCRCGSRPCADVIAERPPDTGIVPLADGCARAGRTSDERGCPKMSDQVAESIRPRRSVMVARAVVLGVAAVAMAAAGMSELAFAQHRGGGGG